MNALAMQSTLTPSARTSVIVRATSQETRRQVLSGLVAGVVSLTALKAGAVDLQDERDVRQRGFDIIYEARDLDLDQSTRDGLTQYRKNIDSTKARIKEAERILDNNLDPLIQKKYWTQAREELRNQVGNLRFDLNTLIESSSKSKADKKQAQNLKKDFLIKVEEFDYFIRKKDQSKAGGQLAEVKSALDAVRGALPV
ncbi:MAG: oxygen-evolving enhancer chloroplast precursor [Trebouxia sp. A1-2]|nr:MAG: oxygen-evolving enhancer chloroplast precursor [Trebouxia sp. A1-2]